MYYISDYIDYYKESDLETVKWNIMDNLVCTILAYLPIDGFTASMNLKSFYSYAVQYEKEEAVGNMIPMAFKVLKKVAESARYKDMVISDFENNKSNMAQFGAMTIRIGRITVIVYKGTDHSIIGWMENFRIAYEYPTYTQNLAIEYMKRNIKSFRDKKIYVTGHSKGGNLAIVSAMEMENRIFRNIEQVCNFDGPGLRKEEYEGEKFNRLKNKLVNIIPEGSIVGMLMYNKEYTVVKTAPASINDHYPDTWRMFGEFFVQGTLSGISTRVHENILNGVEKFSYTQVEEAFENIFGSIEQEHTSNLNLSPETILSFIKNMKDVDKEIAGTIYDIMKTLL